MNNKKTLHRLFEFAESCKGLLTGSVVFAVLSEFERRRANFVQTLNLHSILGYLSSCTFGKL